MKPLYVLALLAALPAGASESADCFYDLAATRNYELGYATKAVPTPDGKAVLYLRSSARDTTQHLYEYDIESGREKELVTPETLLGGASETLSVEEKARRERARVTAKGFTEFQLTDDGTRVLVGLSGKLYTVSRADGSVKTVPGEGWIAPRLSADGTHLAAVKNGDVHMVQTPAKGHSSFTAGQARSRIAKAGFTGIDGLMKTESGMWQAKAMKDGQPVTVMLDYKGNVSAQ